MVKAWQAVGALVLCCAAGAGEAEPADLSLRIDILQELTYAFSVNTSTISQGTVTRIVDQVPKTDPVRMQVETSTGMNLLLKGLVLKRDTSPVSARIRDHVYFDRRTLGEQKSELYVSSRKVKFVENDKTLIDSENDIGLDQLAVYQNRIKAVEAGELRMQLDATGKQLDVQGDASVVATLQQDSAHGVFPPLPGKTLSPGESWTSRDEIPRMAELRLAKPAVMEGKYTFAGWEMKDGERLAKITIEKKWTSLNLAGEGADGMLAELRGVEIAGTGTAWFDPAKHRYVSGEVTMRQRYEIKGEKGPEQTTLRIEGSNHTAFALKK